VVFKKLKFQQIPFPNLHKSYPPVGERGSRYEYREAAQSLDAASSSARDSYRQRLVYFIHCLTMLSLRRGLHVQSGGKREKYSNNPTHESYFRPSVFNGSP